MFEAVLFDLDGTFADTAPDLAAALNRLRIDEGLDPLPAGKLRAFTSQGVRGMLKAGLGMHRHDTRYTEFHERFLAYYSQNICVATKVFPGVHDLVGRMDRLAMPWGIVTNKAQRFTLPLLERLGYVKRASCVVSGDSSLRAKPAPQPLRLACHLIHRDPGRCLYVGDDSRDIAAGRAAGMTTVAVRYGYLGDGDPIENWGADHLISRAEELAALAGVD